MADSESRNKVAEAWVTILPSFSKFDTALRAQFAKMKPVTIPARLELKGVDAALAQQLSAMANNAAGKALGQALAVDIADGIDAGTAASTAKLRASGRRIYAQTIEGFAGAFNGRNLVAGVGRSGGITGILQRELDTGLRLPTEKINARGRVIAQTLSNGLVAGMRRDGGFAGLLQRELDLGIKGAASNIEVESAKWAKRLADGEAAIVKEAAAKRARLEANARKAAAQTAAAASRDLEATIKATIAETNRMAAAAERTLDGYRGRLNRWAVSMSGAATKLRLFMSKDRDTEVRAAQAHVRMLDKVAAATGSVRGKLLTALSGAGRGGSVALVTNALSAGIATLTGGVKSAIPALAGMGTQLGAVGAQMTAAAAAAGPAGIALAAVAAAAAAAIAPLVALGAALAGVIVKMSEVGFQQGASLQLVSLQLETILQSAEKAQQIKASVIALAKESITSTESLLSATRLLAAFGVTDVQDLQGMTKFIADYAAGAGLATDQVQQLALALAQVRAMGRLMGQERIQLANLGIATDEVFQSLGKYANKSSDELRRLGEAGKLSADDFFKGLEIRYAGLTEMAAKAAQTTSGLLAKIKDNIELGLGQAFENADGPLSKVQAVLAKIATLTTKIRFDKLAAAIGVVVDAIVTGLGGRAQDTFDNLATFINDTLPRAIARFSAVIGGVIGVVKSLVISFAQPFKILWGAFDEGQGQADGLVVAMKAILAGATAIASAFQALVAVVRGTGEVFHTLTAILAGLAKVFFLLSQRDVAGAWQAFNDAKDQISTGWGDVAGDIADGMRATRQAYLDGVASIEQAARDAQAGEAMVNSLKLPPDGIDKAIADVTSQLAKAKQAMYEAARNEWKSYIAGLKDGLKEARDQRRKIVDEFRAFRTSIIDSMTGYVNDLNTGTREITTVRYFRDNATKTWGWTSITSTVSNSLLSQMRERLGRVKQFVANLRTAMRRGVDKGLLRTIIEAGPEAGFDAAKELATKSDAYIRQINSIEKELNDTVKSAAQEFGADYYGTAVSNARYEVVRLKDLVAQAKIDMRKDLESIVPKGPDGLLRGQEYGAAVRMGIDAQFHDPIKATIKLITQWGDGSDGFWSGVQDMTQPLVQVYIGDRDITDIVDVRVGQIAREVAAEAGSWI